MAKKAVYKGKRIPPPKQGIFGKRLREYRKKLKSFGKRV
jgi:hypothetical protein